MEGELELISRYRRHKRTHSWPANSSLSLRTVRFALSVRHSLETMFVREGCAGASRGEKVHDDADPAGGHGFVSQQLRAPVFVSASLESGCLPDDLPNTEYPLGLSPFSGHFRY